MSASNINLNELYFEYKVLPRIVGEPTFNHLHEILKQLKANTCAVPCTLGGGANGYLGMLVTPLKYATIAPGTPFVAPQMPGALLINPTDTQYQIAINLKQEKKLAAANEVENKISKSVIYSNLAQLCLNQLTSVQIGILDMGKHHLSVLFLMIKRKSCAK